MTIFLLMLTYDMPQKSPTTYKYVVLNIIQSRQVAMRNIL